RVAEFVSDDLGEPAAAHPGTWRHVVLNHEIAFGDRVGGVRSRGVRAVARVEGRRPLFRAGHAVEPTLADDSGAGEGAGDLTLRIVEEHFVHAVRRAEAAHRARARAGV